MFDINGHSRTVILDVHLGKRFAHQYESHVRESLVRLTDVGQAGLVQQDLLQDEGGHRLGQLAARLHDP